MRMNAPLWQITYTLKWVCPKCFCLHKDNDLDFKPILGQNVECKQCEMESALTDNSEQGTKDTDGTTNDS